VTHYNIELVHNSAMKDDLKSSVIDVLWVVSGVKDTGNNGKNGKVCKKWYIFDIGVRGLEFGGEICGEDFRFVYGRGVGFGLEFNFGGGG